MKPPIKNFNVKNYPEGCITQWFGENKELYSRMNMNGHNGIDIVAPHGTPIYSVEDGIVLEVKNDPSGYGKHVRVITNGVECREWTYGHCDTILVEQNQIVYSGQQIATMGNTGFVVSGSTPYWKYNPFAGTHLHLGVRKMLRVKKGWKYIGSNISLQSVDYDNGFKGAIDPKQFIIELSDDSIHKEKLINIISILTKIVSLLKKRNEIINN